MKFSIITPVLNGASTLPAVLESVHSQRRPHLEVEHIVADGASTDGTLDVLKRWPHPVTVSSEPDKGVYQALNRGLRLATGDVVGWLNASDVYTSKSVLSTACRAFSLYPEIAAVFGDLMMVSSTDPEKVSRRMCCEKFAPELLKYGIAPPHPTLLVRRGVFEKIGPYAEDYLIAADFQWMLRFWQSGLQWAYLPYTMVKMQAGGLSTRPGNVLTVNTEEKLRALRQCGMPGRRWLLWYRYLWGMAHQKAHPAPVEF